MNRSIKIYNHEKDMKRGFSWWIPDTFDTQEGHKFVDRMIRKILIPVGQDGEYNSTTN